ncbi:sigma-70 family RNA polymerase sigma factor [Afipia clevelandensis]|uniref:Sigma-70 family RNA polymerase sigma factor n=1 Tax=Afipia clevelandensis ATCC 49720 TaxID=883079 RepID=K8P1Z6_9BRAD|nr:sigma-70 family RNA polymerase sigma factor [Afipia clevelandensis]EKS35481.1 sigma-70 family RNA polymerase sigma factor [Afipia clevelandensis ATCC 49720]
MTDALDARTQSSLLDHARNAQLAAALARCAVGDRSALQMIYDSESARMIGVTRRILIRQDLAEEAVHDAFVRIWQGAAGFDPQRGSAIGWLYAIVRNRALSIYRSEHRYDPADEIHEITADDAMSRLPETSALRRCLEAIERPRRDVVVLAYAHGMSHGELAGRLKVPLGTVKSWVRRSLISLQECMG